MYNIIIYHSTNIIINKTKKQQIEWRDIRIKDKNRKINNSINIHKKNATNERVQIIIQYCTVIYLLSMCAAV